MEIQLQGALHIKITTLLCYLVEWTSFSCSEYVFLKQKPHWKDWDAPSDLHTLHFVGGDLWIFNRASKHRRSRETPKLRLDVHKDSLIRNSAWAVFIYSLSVGWSRDQTLRGLNTWWASALRSLGLRSGDVTGLAPSLCFHIVSRFSSFIQNCINICALTRLTLSSSHVIDTTPVQLSPYCTTAADRDRDQLFSKE